MDGPQMLFPEHKCRHVLCHSCWFELSNTPAEKLCPQCKEHVGEWLQKAGYYRPCICKDKPPGVCVCIPCKIHLSNVTDFQPSFNCPTRSNEGTNRTSNIIFSAGNINYVRKQHLNDKTCYKCRKKYTIDNCKFIPNKRMKLYGAVRTCTHGHCYNCLTEMKNNCTCQQYCELCATNLALWLRYCFV